MTEASDRPQTSQTPVIASSETPLETKEEKPIIGKECIVEERDKFGKVVNYKCTICDCDMNNKYMRDDHLKGRKHLTEYKLKVNPNLQVDIFVGNVLVNIPRYSIGSSGELSSKIYIDSL